MRQRTIILTVLFVVFAVGASAQKYPERRVARAGDWSYDAGNFEEAETTYRRALELQPEFPEASFNLASALFRQQKAEEAAELWMEQATDSLADPRLVSAANFNLGNAMLAGQKIDEAIEFYKQALRIDPTDEQAKYNLAYAQKLKKEQEQDEQQDQNQDQDQQDENSGGGDDDQNNERPDDSEGDKDDNNGENEPRDDEQPQDGENEGENEQNNGENPREGESDGDGQADGEPKIDPQAAAQMLDAIQAEEDETREKVNARQVQAAPRSGKNW